jgi:hypothetical protein
VVDADGPVTPERRAVIQQIADTFVGHPAVGRVRVMNRARSVKGEHGVRSVSGEHWLAQS